FALGQHAHGLKTSHPPHDSDPTRAERRIQRDVSGHRRGEGQHPSNRARRQDRPAAAGATGDRAGWPPHLPRGRGRCQSAGARGSLETVPRVAARREIEGAERIETAGESMILAGDVGGTKCNLALFEARPGALRRITQRRFESKTHPHFEEIVAEFLQQIRANTSEGGTGKITAAGLGVAILFWDGNRHIVAATEGGHTDFAPRTEKQIELLRHLMKRYTHVDFEIVLSGRGFRSIHEFLDPTVRHPSFDNPEVDPAPEITQLGLAGSCPICVQTLDLWTSVYGAEAGNLALKCLALGGVYVAGGIAVKILPKLKDGTFFRAFCDKAKFEILLNQIPIHVVL